MTYYDKNALKLSHAYLKEHIRPGDVVVDATCGKGRDTLLLSQLAGEHGRVLAMDIQQEAIDATRLLLEENGQKNVELICDDHKKISQYCSRARAVVFNLGFLPGSDHRIFSRGETSVSAISAALSLLENDGFITICSYYGGDTGFEERDCLLAFLETLDQKEYTVMLHSFLNRRGCPPLFLVIEKNRCI